MMIEAKPFEDSSCREGKWSQVPMVSLRLTCPLSQCEDKLIFDCKIREYLSRVRLLLLFVPGIKSVRITFCFFTFKSGVLPVLVVVVLFVVVGYIVASVVSGSANPWAEPKMIRFPDYGDLMLKKSLSTIAFTRADRSGVGYRIKSVLMSIFISNVFPPLRWIK